MACLLAAALLAWPRLATWHEGRFADRLADRALLTTGPGGAQAIQRLARLGDASTAPLVRLAASQRADIAQAAQSAIASMVAGWEVEYAEVRDPAAYSQDLQTLSAALERHAGQFGAAGQHWARKLARRIVAAVGDLSPANAWLVLARCERVLDAPLAAAIQPERSSADGSNLWPTGRLVPAQGTATLTVTMPGPAKPVEPLAAAAQPTADIALVAPPTSPNVFAPSFNAVEPPIATFNALRSPELPPAIPGGAGQPPATSQPPEATITDVPSPQDMRHSAERLRRHSDRELIALLDQSPRFEAAAARRVLHARGYSDDALEMTRALGKLPLRERRDAVERAASLPAADARRLLRWFVADEDAEVRLKALAMLATTGDPQLPEIVRQRAVEDADPRVADLATELMKRQ